MRSRTPIGAASFVLGLVLALALGLLTACSSDPSDDEPAAPEPSTSITPSTSAPTETELETESSSPTVTPATGPEITLLHLDVPVLKLRLPEGADWRIQPGDDGASTNNAAGDFVDISGFGLDTVSGKSLGFYANLVIDGGKDPLYPGLERVEGRTVDGVTGYVAEGSAKLNGVPKFSYVFGAVYGDSHVQVDFQFARDDAEAREWIESTLASAEWL